ncbi:MAG: methyltransferase domain-containing protein [Lachnoanaerobaculum sp.]|uniref:class I SAM-dependent methyltransferase n=1 Tax=Lachnoanaerobaculum sp. TaxID=2049030 RepID=UPI0025C03F31|nr:class I SAM-dependent methyltransferase [Lachnoanaerobaculum sp.]MBS5882713.1 methyltransferase domain-containing protein [Lachnoanaerobaculum sp.]
MKKCISCKGSLHELMKIENMPASAQDIPTKEELDKDCGIEVSLCVCEDCGLVQLKNDAVYYYRDVIRAGGYSTTMEALRKSQYKHFIEFASLEGKKIIEVGCGRGEFLGMLSDFPVEGYGTEHKKDLVEIAKEAGLRVDEDFPEREDHIFKNGPFDAFMSFNFLEHQPNPRTYLKAIYNNLCDEGYGLITVPSFEYIMEQNSFYEIIPDHIAYYSFESLTHLLNICGFEVLEKETVNRDTISMIVKKRKLPDICGIISKKNDIATEVVETVKKYAKAGKIAIWGASHQGFTLCATTGIADYVYCIIDSAPFKQGKYAPASHIPIISPDEARKRKLEAIIIVAPGYTNEIANIIKTNFENGIDIYTLMTDRLSRI